MDQSVIDHVSQLGFDVYMRDPKDSWMIFAEGDQLGCLSENRFGGYDIGTVHKPNTHCGTGYSMHVDVPLPDRDTLRSAFVKAPHWAYGRDVAHVVKYKGIEDYRKRDTFNAAYKLVAKGTVSS